MMNLKPKLVVLVLALQLSSSYHASAAVTATTLYSLGYPVGLAEDSSGNIYIADDHNSDAAKRGIVVVPATTGTLFGQAVTAGVPKTIVEVSNPAGIAISSSGVLVWSLSNGDIYGLTSSAQTLFGVSISADTVTQIVTGTGLRGGLDFDGAGNLYGVYLATGTFAVFPAASGTLFGQSVTANTSTTLYSNGSNWFWDLAVDSAGNVYVSDGWGLQGVFVLPVSTGSLLGQSVTANTFVRLTSFGTARYAGIDVDASDALYANTYGGTTRVISPTPRTIFQQSVTANTFTNLTATSGYILQGLLIAAGGNIISGGNRTYRLVATPDLTIPGAPTIGSAIATGPTSATVSFSAPASNGGATIETYTATSTPGSIVGKIYQASSGTITVTGLTPSTSYTFQVSASNSVGTSSSSSATISMTTPASSEELASQLLAAQRAAEAAREAAIRAAKNRVMDSIETGLELKISDLNDADLFGVTSKNIIFINEDLANQVKVRKVDFETVAKLVTKYVTVDKIALKVGKFNFRNLEEIGLIGPSESHKTSIVMAIRNLETENLDTYEKLQKVVANVQGRFASRSEALRQIQRRIQARK